MVIQISCCIILDIGNAYYFRSGSIAGTIGNDECLWLMLMSGVLGHKPTEKMTEYIWKRKGNRKWKGTFNEYIRYHPNWDLITVMIWWCESSVGVLRMLLYCVCHVFCLQTELRALITWTLVGRFDYSCNEWMECVCVRIKTGTHISTEFIIESSNSIQFPYWIPLNCVYLFGSLRSCC